MSDDTEEKTEEPTRHKLKEARKRGDVAKSRDLTSAVSFLGVFLALWLGADLWRDQAMAVLDTALSLLTRPRSSPGQWTLADVWPMLQAALWLVLPLLLVAVAAGMLAAFVQTGGVFSTEPLKLKFENLNPGNALKKLMSTQQLGVLIQMILKALLIAGSAYYILRLHLAPLLMAVHGEPSQATQPARSALHQLLAACAAIYLVLGALDYLQQFFEYLKKNRMSKSERRRETKDQEGDPHLRAALRSQRRALAEALPGTGMAQANVVVTNPTHYAVGLYYESGVVELPIVVAKGVDAQAMALRAQAAQLAVPLFESPPLARSLFANVEVGQPILDEHIDAVAEVFRWIASLQRPSTNTDTGTD